MGRPTDYSTELAVEICERMILGGSIRSICASEDMPGETTIYRWLVANEGFREKYRCAREVQQEAFLEEMIREATDRSGDMYMDGNQLVPNHANVARSKVITDNLKWVMSRMSPRKYGDKPEAGLVGSDGVTRIERLIIRWEDPDPLPPAPPPAQITYDPGVLPKRLDPEIMARFLRMIKDTVPRADQRSPDEVLTLALDVCERALKAEFCDVADAVSA
jgi:hypothetical protein